MLSRFSCIFFLAAVTFTSCHSPAPEQSERADKAPRPNIIFIMADDLGYGDLGSYGQSMIKTPNIDKMAREGMRFTDFYAGSTVCAPSRSALLTGMHTGHTRIRGNAAEATLTPADTTLTQVMKDAGYQTGVIGKWGVGPEGSPGLPGKKGVDYFYGYLDQIRAHNYYPEWVWENDTRDSLDNVVELIPETYARNIGGVAREKNTYIQDKFMEKTLDFIDRHQDSTFFLYLAFTLPHANNESAYFGLSGMEIPDAGAYAEEDWPEAQRQHAAMISRLDRDVGLILNRLKELGIDENTLVIFTSDNGPHEEGGADPEFFHSNGPLRGIKRDLFEGGIRVPMIARWPGHVEPGTTCELPSAFWDIMPTLGQLAGGSPPAADGISLVPSLLGQGDQPRHDYLYWEFAAGWIGDQQAVRMGDWKYIRKQLPGGETETWLFNLESDESEQTNVADEHPEVVARMDSLLREAHEPSEKFPLMTDLAISN